MALGLFELTKGLSLDDNVHILEGAGVPGLTADTNAAPVGSMYLDHDSGDMFTKHTAGSGSDKWQKMASEDFVNAALGTTISWREPVEVVDDASTTLPTGTAGNPITIDGISIIDGERVLFSAIVGGDGPNVYIYDQTTGTFSEDTNLETSGDTVYVSQGSDAGKRFTYNGTAWVQTDGTTVDELQYIRDFIGKNAAGAENPNYSSINVVTQGGSLEQAIGELDAEIGGAVTSNSIITNTNSVNQNIQEIANFVEDNSKETTALNVTTITTVDATLADMSKWIVRVEEVATPGNVKALEVFATHDGTNVDSTQYGVLKLGSPINGLTVDVTLTGGNTLNLTVASTAAVNVKAKRVAVF